MRLSAATAHLIAILTSIGATALTRSAMAAPLVVDRLEASVNNSLILLSDIRKFRRTMKLRAQIDPLFTGTAVATKGGNANDEEIREFLINERLIGQQFSVNDAEVESEINQIQSNNRMTRDTLRDALAEQGFTFDEYFEMIRAGASKRNLIDRDIRTKVTISDDDVKNYFFNHFARTSRDSISYRIQVITFQLKNYRSQAAARDTADRALREIKAGEPFEEMAKRLSDDPSAPSGGDLGILSEEQLNPAMRDQVKRLQIGQVSDVFSATNGYYLIRLADLKTADSERLEKQREEIRAQLAAVEYQHQISIWLERQRQSAFIHRVGQPAVAAIPSLGK